MTHWKKIEEYNRVINPKHTQVVVAVCLEHKKSGRKVFLVSLHLKSGYDDMEERRCREFRQAMKLVVDKFPEVVDAPLVVAGDLNSDFVSSKLIQGVHKAMWRSEKLIAHFHTFFTELNANGLQ